MPLEDFMFPFTNAVKCDPPKRPKPARADAERPRRVVPGLLSSLLVALRSLLP
jgi:hypothetical protein